MMNGMNKTGLKFLSAAVFLPVIAFAFLVASPVRADEATGYCYILGAGPNGWQLYSNGMTQAQCAQLGANAHWYTAPQITPPNTPPPADAPTAPGNAIADCFVNGQVIPNKTQAECSTLGGAQSAQTGATPGTYVNPTTQIYTCAGGNCQLTYTPLEPLSSPTGGVASADVYANLGAYLNYLFPILISIGALIGVVMFTVGGVIYMTSSVAGDKSKAIERMKASLWGLLLLISSVLILKVINPQLVVFDLQSLGTAGTQSQTD